MDASNFGVDDKGKTCLFDFTEVGLLPESFASYTMSSPTPSTAPVAQHLKWPCTPNLDSMIEAHTGLAMLADPTRSTSTCT